MSVLAIFHPIDNFVASLCLNQKTISHLIVRNYLDNQGTRLPTSKAILGG
jgi:hypothetical protein